MERLTRLLIGANVVVFALEAVSGPGFLASFALWPVGHFVVAQFDGPVGFRLWQLITCGFLHANLLHLAINAPGTIIMITRPYSHSSIGPRNCAPSPADSRTETGRVERSDLQNPVIDSPTFETRLIRIAQGLFARGKSVRGTHQLDVRTIRSENLIFQTPAGEVLIEGT